MKLDFCLHTSGNDWHREHVCEVLRQSGWVDPFDLATSELCKRAQTVKVALVALDRHDIYCDACSAGDLANALVELLSSSRVFGSVALIEGTKADVSQTICADDNRGARRALCCHCYGSQDAWTESRGAGLLYLIQLLLQVFGCVRNWVLKLGSCCSFTIVLEPLEVVQMVSSNVLDSLGTVTDD